MAPVIKAKSKGNMIMKKTPKKFTPKKPAMDFSESDIDSDDDLGMDPEEFGVLSDTASSSDEEVGLREEEEEDETQIELPEVEESDEEPVLKKPKKENETVSQAQGRTIFVGNVPLDTSESRIKKFFANYGPVGSVRIRGVPRADLSTPKKVAVIKKEFHEGRTNCIAFVVFKDETSARSALIANGTKPFDGIHQIRVDLASTSDYDKNKAVFLGHLPFDIEEDAVHELFSDCGDIISVRLVRDNNTSVGKGFGFVNFADQASVPLALEKNGAKLGSRTIRVMRCEAKKNQPSDRGAVKPKKEKKERWRNRDQATAFQGDTAEKKPKRLGKKKLLIRAKKSALVEVLNKEQKKKEPADGTTAEKESNEPNLKLQRNTVERKKKFVGKERLLNGANKVGFVEVVNGQQNKRPTSQGNSVKPPKKLGKANDSSANHPETSESTEPNLTFQGNTGEMKKMKFGKKDRRNNSAMVDVLTKELTKKSPDLTFQGNAVEKKWKKKSFGQGNRDPGEKLTSSPPEPDRAKNSWKTEGKKPKRLGNTNKKKVFPKVMNWKKTTIK